MSESAAGHAPRLMTEEGVGRRLAELSPAIDEVGVRYGVPRAAIVAILRAEMGDMDVLDPLADLAVRASWLLSSHGVDGASAPGPLGKVLGKRDSSVGYGQVFGRTGVLAANFALEHGLPWPEGLARLGPGPLDPGSPADVHVVWLAMRDDVRTNLELVALNLLSCAEEACGTTDIASLSDEGLMRAFSRYNANTCEVTAYGRRAWELYARELES